ncbi:MAG TPA: FtsX-like permease family protein, partial [Phycisphaerales bacterium]|nr:FtsX-like permease family protein [Phycisphaerales bacterium]
SDAVPLVNPRTGKDGTFIGYGVMPELEYAQRSQLMESGRSVVAPGEIVLDTVAAEVLAARVGDVLDVRHFGPPERVRVVGIARQPALGVLGKAETFLHIDDLRRFSGLPGSVSEVDILLEPGADPEAVVGARSAGLPRGVVLRVSSKITSGLDKNLRSSQIGLVIASTLSFLAAAFIIMTGMTTAVTERQRELAILRCLGARRRQLAASQLWTGAMTGALGASLGAPLGVLGAYVLVRSFPDVLPGGFAMSWLGLALAVAGAVAAGLIGAAWPAVRAARTSPLAALAARAHPPRGRVVLACLLAGLCLVLVHVLVMTVPQDGNVIFWADVSLGLPCLFSGYFLLSVPVMVGVTWLAGPAVGRALGLPPTLLTASVRATPFRHGFTAGAMMLGLAILLAIWTNGRAVERDWLGALEFPDAFVSGRNLREETQQQIERVPGVTGTCAVTLQNLRTTAFGIRALQEYQTTFVAFEPDEFFAMTRLTWVRGDLESARRRLHQGGAVLVAREFLVSKGLGVGDRITLGYEGKEYQFEIAGVVASPGLDVAAKFFDIGDQYVDQAVNAVFGTRRDLKERFGNTAINLIQIAIDPGADDQEVMRQVRRLVGVGVISAGSGRQIKQELSALLEGSLLVSSIIAVSAMLVACFGVANLIVAGVQARTFEFGVLRALGAHRGQVARLVLGEAILIGLCACLLGSVMGVHASWGGQRMYAVLIGLSLSVRVPWGALGAGCAAVMLITVLAAAPAAVRLAGRRPRELLAQVRG